MDQELFEKTDQQNHVRFTLARYAGHLALHRAHLRQLCEPVDTTVTDGWMRHLSHYTADDLNAMRHQASEFAGRLMVPLPELTRAVNNRLSRHTTDTLANDIAPLFRVTPNVIAIRIERERVLTDDTTKST
jgi:Zn-dependent peptidase ImmA (M78 family)